MMFNKQKIAVKVFAFAGDLLLFVFAAVAATVFNAKVMMYLLDNDAAYYEKEVIKKCVTENVSEDICLEKYGYGSYTSAGFKAED